MKSISEQVDDFMLSNHNNLWLNDNILSVYVRKNYRNINGVLTNTFDVANIKSIKKKYEHKGYFKAFMLKVESLGIPIVVECIHNPDLVDMLERNGYTIISSQYNTDAYKQSFNLKEDKNELSKL